MNILKKTKWLDKIYLSVSFRLRKFCLDNDIKNHNDLPKCPVCNVLLKWDGSRKRFQTFCSRKCSNTTLGQSIRLEKSKKTWTDNYGVDNPTKNKEIIAKIKKIKKERYGDSNYNNQEKSKKTCKEKYGTEHVLSLKSIHQKSKKSKKKKYGDENYRNKDKSKATMLKRYGVKSSFQLEKTRLSSKKSIKKKFGVEFPLQSSKIRDKSKKTIQLKYGVDNPAKVPKVKEKISMSLKRNHYETLCKQLELKHFKMLELKDIFIKNKIHTYKCLKCNNVFTSSSTNIQYIFCPNSIHKVSSKFEEDIVLWLKELNIKNIERNKRYYYDGTKFYDIDIFLPYYKLGIEFHGLYWHSDINKPKTLHSNKYLFFKEKGIQLIQIFENEWCLPIKKDIVKSIIVNRLGLTQRKIYARKCIIEILDNDTYKQFIQLNHLQGYVNASIRLGLFFGSELVGVFATKHKANYYELARLCFKINVNVVGGFSKLLKYFENHYESLPIKSFVDNRYFTGQGYIKNGFIFSHITKPNYFYFKNGKLILHSRLKFQKHKLKNKLYNFDFKLTEYQNMINNGYLRIFDAGNLCVVKYCEK